MKHGTMNIVYSSRSSAERASASGTLAASHALTAGVPKTVHMPGTHSALLKICHHKRTSAWRTELTETICSLSSGGLTFAKTAAAGGEAR